MANDFIAMGSALASYLGTAGTVAVWYALAPQNTQPPYCIVQRQAATDEYTFTDNGVNTLHVVKIVSNRNWPGEAYQIYTHIHEALTDAPLNVGTAFKLLRCRRSNTIEFQDPSKYWHVGGVYRIDLWEI